MGWYWLSVVEAVEVDEVSWLACTGELGYEYRRELLSVTAGDDGSMYISS